MGGDVGDLGLRERALALVDEVADRSEGHELNENPKMFAALDEGAVVGHDVLVAAHLQDLDLVLDVLRRLQTYFQICEGK